MPRGHVTIKTGPSPAAFAACLEFYVGTLGMQLLAMQPCDAAASVAAAEEGAKAGEPPASPRAVTRAQRAWLRIGGAGLQPALLVCLTPSADHPPTAKTEAKTDAPLSRDQLNRQRTVLHVLVPDLGAFQGSKTASHVTEGGAVYLLDPLGQLVRIEAESAAGDFWGGREREGTDSPSGGASPSIPRPVASDRPRRIGVLTSGGDSPGMNAAVRAITRYALTRGCEPYAIYEGYQGLVDGGSLIKPLEWDSVRGFLGMGGTAIGTARCAEFRERAGRLRATRNLLEAGIDALVVIGGDGSLTGADILRSEWPSLVAELEESGAVARGAAAAARHLTIVGLVGSIDNDMSSTDLTIGAVSSLHRICEAVDSLSSTALSHQRAFVVEVMGRHCGWLALMAATAVGADWVFLPERPPPLRAGREWEAEMCERIQEQRALGNRKTIVIVCEGAIDRELRPIKSDYVKQVLETRLQLDTRVTNLGHVQRGGRACAFDRVLATVQGVRAVDEVLAATPETPSPMIGLSQNKVTAQPLVEAVRLTHQVGEAISRKDFARAMELRDPDFNAAYSAYAESTILAPRKASPDAVKLRVAIVHVGAPAGGMNAATRAAVRLCLNRGHVPLGVSGGFDGFVGGHVKALTWQTVSEWVTRGGSELGTSRTVPGSSELPLGRLAYALQHYEVDSLLLIGGFEAFSALLALEGARAQFPAFCVPMVHLPATISNNVPGTDFSLGSDTALNALVEACDVIKQSASASRNRVFVVEVQGGHCGYLAVVGGLTTGATNVYTPEHGVSLEQLGDDVRHLCHRYREEKRAGIPSEGRLLLRNEATAADAYSTDVISHILRAEGRGLFDSRTAVLGHLQQGGIPSPMDRIRALRLAVDCIDWFECAAHASLGGALPGRAASLETIGVVNRDLPPNGSTASPASHSPVPDGRPAPLSGAAANLVDDDDAVARPLAAALQSASSAALPRGLLPRIYTTDPATATVIGIRGARVVFTPVTRLVDETDMSLRRSRTVWWHPLHRLIRVMSKYEYYRLSGSL